MRKIPTLFVRDPDDLRRVLPEATPGCEWVLAGEGVPTRKYDGTCVMLDASGEWWARREVKPGKAAPDRFVQVDHDPVTGKSVGWEPISQSAFAKFHAEAVADVSAVFEPGTYELIGPKINGNPEGEGHHRLRPHASAQRLEVAERSFDGIREAVLTLRAVDGAEGVVFHHPDGRMAKIKARDFRVL